MKSGLRIKLVAGVMIPRCGIRDRQGNQCFGHQHIPVSLDEAATIRHGRAKTVKCHFSCGHKSVQNIVIEA